MASKAPTSITNTESNRPPATGGKSLSSIPIPRRSSAAESNSDDDEDVGLTVSEDDDANSDKEDENENENENEDENEDENEESRIKALAEDSPHLLAFLGKESDSDPQNSNAIATTSEEENDDDDSDNAVDDSSIEEEEEAAIRAELGRKNRRRSIPGPVSLRRLSQTQQARRRSQENSEEDSGGDSDESSLSDSSSWGNEYIEDYFDQPVSHAKQANKSQRELDASENDGSDSDDESHLWQYFFSSEEPEETFDGLGNEQQSPSRGESKPRQLTVPKQEEGLSEADGSTDEDVPLKGRGPVPLPQHNQSGYVPSGDSTDEDDGVPPERKRRRARGTKAIEVLGSNSFSTRPPVLGSWRIKGDKNVGIIDGLTTRTLSPPPPMRQDSFSQFDGSPRTQDGTPQGHSTLRANGEPVDPFENLGDTPTDSVTGLFGDIGESSFDLGATPVQSEHGTDMHGHPMFDDVEVSDLDLLELGDYINTNGMSSDDNENDQDHDNLEFEIDFEQALQQQQPPPRQYRSPIVSPYIYRSRFPSRSVPISAFRNRGSPYVHNPAYPSDNPSPAPRRTRGSSVTGRRPSIPRDALMSPARQNRKRPKKLKAGSGPRSALAGHHPLQNHQSHDDGTHDLIGELIEIGAISPIFDINQ